MSTKKESSPSYKSPGVYPSGSNDWMTFIGTDEVLSEQASAWNDAGSRPQQIQTTQAGEFSFNTVFISAPSGGGQSFGGDATQNPPNWMDDQAWGGDSSE